MILHFWCDGKYFISRRYGTRFGTSQLPTRLFQIQLWKTSLLHSFFLLNFQLCSTRNVKNIGLGGNWTHTSWLSWLLRYQYGTTNNTDRFLFWEYGLDSVLSTRPCNRFELTALSSYFWLSFLRKGTFFPLNDLEIPKIKYRLSRFHLPYRVYAYDKEGERGEERGIKRKEWEEGQEKGFHFEQLEITLIAWTW